MYPATDVRRSVVSVCVSVSSTQTSCAKTDEPIEISFEGGGQTQVGTRNHVLNGVQIVPRKKSTLVGKTGSAQCKVLSLAHHAVQAYGSLIGRRGPDGLTSAYHA